MTDLFKMAGIKPFAIICVFPLLLMGIQACLWKAKKNWNLALPIVALSLSPILYALHLSDVHTMAAYEGFFQSTPENMVAVLSHGKAESYSLVAVGTWFSGILLLVSGAFYAVGLPLVANKREVKNV